MGVLRHELQHGDFCSHPSTISVISSNNISTRYIFDIGCICNDWVNVISCIRARKIIKCIFKKSHARPLAETVVNSFEINSFRTF